MNCALILAAGGSGKRLGAADPKAFVELAGETLLARSFAALQRESRFGQAVIVTPPGWCERADQLVRPRLRASLALRIVEGGASRQDSVRHGLDAIAEPCDVVVVHDAARPFVRLGDVTACIDSAIASGAATVAHAITDTVKEVDAEARVVRTLDRDRLRMVQSPQAFRFELLRAAHREAVRLALTTTDDAALIEATGGAVATVAGDPANRKITTAEDLAWARWWLQERERR